MIEPQPPMPPEIRRWLNDLQAGMNVTVGEVALATTPATTTVVPCRGCSTGSIVVLMPVDAGAATEFGAGSWYVTAEKTQFTVTHSASASTRTFRYVTFRGTKPL